MPNVDTKRAKNDKKTNDLVSLEVFFMLVQQILIAPKGSTTPWLRITDLYEESCLRVCHGLD